MRAVLISILCLGLAGPAVAEGFNNITDRARFVSLVKDRDLTRFGISLNVTPEGQIKGRAFGRDVTGAWKWNGDYFCRDLYWGSTNLGPNCQAVRLQGNKLRFITDQGSGQYADLYLK